MALARKRFRDAARLGLSLSCGLEANGTAADTEAELKTQWRAVQRTVARGAMAFRRWLG